MQTWADERPDDWAGAAVDDVDRCADDLDSEWEDEPEHDGVSDHESAWCKSDPFLRPEHLWTPQDLADRRRANELVVSRLRPRRLSADELRSMLTWDRSCYFGDLQVMCDLHGCEVDGTTIRHAAQCPWKQHCGEELEVHGLALHHGDPAFWERLRKLGVTPEIVIQANAILHPKRARACRSARPNTAVCANRRRTCARPRARRSTPSRRVRTASRGSPGDDGSGEPEPAGGHEPRHHSLREGMLR
jgi:hypothetical protein